MQSLRINALSIVATLRKSGFEALWAGGCVRDQLLGRQPKDYDIATSATPDQIQALFPHTIAIGKAFGVINVVIDGHNFEVATFRKDKDYTDGRRPNGVIFCNAEEDAKRRDFTINGMFYDPIDSKTIDYVGGQTDLRQQIIRAIGDPKLRFAEDHLRMLRAVRFAATLNFRIDPLTANTIKNMAPLIKDISAERIEQELSRLLLESHKAGDALIQLNELGLLKQILPEVCAMIGQEQPPEFHPEGDVFTHTVIMLNALTRRDRILAYATLLHDVGKPPTAEHRKEPDGSMRWRFNEHAPVGATIADNILHRLRLPNKDREAIVTAIRNHMLFSDVQRMRKSKLRLFMGSPTFPIELELHRLDCLASHGKLDNYDFLIRYEQAWAQEPVLPPRWLTGHDVMQMGIPKGPEVGKWLHLAYEKQLEGTVDDREKLLEWLKQQITK